MSPATQTLRLRRVVSRYCTACRRPFALTAIKSTTGWQVQCTSCGRMKPLAGT